MNKINKNQSELFPCNKYCPIKISFMRFSEFNQYPTKYFTGTTYMVVIKMNGTNNLINLFFMNDILSIKYLPLCNSNIAPERKINAGICKE